MCTSLAELLQAESEHLDLKHFLSYVMRLVCFVELIRNKQVRLKLNMSRATRCVAAPEHVIAAALCGPALKSKDATRTRWILRCLFGSP